jgi:hypothetical protein
LNNLFSVILNINQYNDSLTAILEYCAIIDMIVYFWYCEKHDDAYKSYKYSEYDVRTKNCLGDKYCHLNFIVYREYEKNGDIVRVVRDTTPRQSYFDLCAGGFCREMLESVDFC